MHMRAVTPAFFNAGTASATPKYLAAMKSEFPGCNNETVEDTFLRVSEKQGEKI